MGGCCSALCCIARDEADNDSLPAASIASKGTLSGHQPIAMLVAQAEPATGHDLVPVKALQGIIS